MKKNHKILLAVHNLRKDLFCILLICIVFIFIFDFWLIKIPELFKGANTLGNIFYKICLAYLTAYIFYFLNVFIKSQKDLNEVNFYIGRLVTNITLDNFIIIHQLCKSSGIQKSNKYLTETEIKIITSILTINEGPKEGPDDIIKTNWFQFLKYYKVRTENNINKILSRSIYLDSKLVSLLSDIEDSALFIDIEYKAIFEESSDNLSFMASHLYNYFETIKKLETYYLDKLYPYIKYSTIDKD
jgi:hypothetical protein